MCFSAATSAHSISLQHDCCTESLTWILQEDCGSRAGGVDRKPSCRRRQFCQSGGKIGSDKVRRRRAEPTGATGACHRDFGTEACIHAIVHHRSRLPFQMHQDAPERPDSRVTEGSPAGTSQCLCNPQPTFASHILYLLSCKPVQEQAEVLLQQPSSCSRPLKGSNSAQIPLTSFYCPCISIQA